MQALKQKLQSFFSGKQRHVTILVIGLDNSGKSTLVKSLQGDINPKTVPTVGFEKPGAIKHKKYDITLYDLGGGKRIRDVWHQYYDGVHGIIYVVDSADSARLSESGSEFSTFRNLPKVAGKPILVLANKDDLPQKMSEVEIAQALGLDTLVNTPHNIRAVIALPSKTADKRMDPRVLAALDWLTTTIEKDLAALLARVEADIIAQKEAEKARRAAILARVEKERKAREEKEEQEKIKAQEQEAGASKDKDSAKDKPKEKEHDPSVVLCTSCKNSPAVRRCAASKWEAVCNDCAKRMENDAVTGGETDPKKEKEKGKEKAKEDGKENSLKAEGNQKEADKESENVIKCAVCKAAPAARRCAAAKWEAVCEACAQRLENPSASQSQAANTAVPSTATKPTSSKPPAGTAVQAQSDTSGASQPTSKIAPSVASSTKATASPSETSTAGTGTIIKGGTNAGMVDNSAGKSVQEQVTPAEAGSEQIMCNICKMSQADRRTSASRWEPVCGTCAENLERQRSNGVILANSHLTPGFSSSTSSPAAVSNASSLPVSASPTKAPPSRWNSAPPASETAALNLSRTGGKTEQSTEKQSDRSQTEKNLLSTSEALTATVSDRPAARPAVQGELDKVKQAEVEVSTKQAKKESSIAQDQLPGKAEDPIVSRKKDGATDGASKSELGPAPVEAKLFDKKEQEKVSSEKNSEEKKSLDILGERQPNSVPGLIKDTDLKAAKSVAPTGLASLEVSKLDTPGTPRAVTETQKKVVVLSPRTLSVVASPRTTTPRSSSAAPAERISNETSEKVDSIPGTKSGLTPRSTNAVEEPVERKATKSQSVDVSDMTSNLSATATKDEIEQQKTGSLGSSKDKHVLSASKDNSTKRHAEKHAEGLPAQSLEVGPHDTESSEGNKKKVLSPTQAGGVGAESILRRLSTRSARVGIAPDDLPPTQDSIEAKSSRGKSDKAAEKEVETGQILSPRGSDGEGALKKVTGLFRGNNKVGVAPMDETVPVGSGRRAEADGKSEISVKDRLVSPREKQKKEDQLSHEPPKRSENSPLKESDKKEEQTVEMTGNNDTMTIPSAAEEISTEKTKKHSKSKSKKKKKKKKKDVDEKQPEAKVLEDIDADTDRDSIPVSLSANSKTLSLQVQNKSDKRGKGDEGESESGEEGQDQKTRAQSWPKSTPQDEQLDSRAGDIFEERTREDPISKQPVLSSNALSPLDTSSPQSAGTNARRKLKSMEPSIVAKAQTKLATVQAPEEVSMVS